MAKDFARDTRPVRRRAAAHPLGDLVAGLLDPILVRKAGMTSGLVAAWPEIAGLRLEQGCRPEKLVWPARRRQSDPFEPATLVVACEGAFVLRLQHQTGELLARINAFFGYQAVGKVRIVQKPAASARPSRKPVLRPLDGEDRRTVAAATANIENPRLRTALEALGEGVLARRPKPPA